MLRNILPIVVGYLLGSILPAYFFGRIIKGIDIREVGTKNAGTTNVRRQLGILPAIPTAIYDTLKGIISIIIAERIFNVSPFIAYLSGFASVLGHIFPWYLHFRGGQGAATLTGILLFNLYQIFINKRTFFPIWDLVILLITVLFVFFITKTQEVLSIIVLPLFSYLLILRGGLNWTTFTTLLINLYLLIIAIVNIIRFQLIKIDKALYSQFPFWRTFIRPAGFSFVLFSFFLPKKTLLLLIGATLFLFFLFDLIRILHERVDRFFVRDMKRLFILLKEKEARRVSSMTIFLLGSFLTFLLFENRIAVFAISFLIFGDFFAKIFGLAYGRHKFFNKTMEGTFAHFLGSLLFGYLLFTSGVALPIGLIFLGAGIGTLVELLPLNVDDNLSVPLLSGSILFLTLQFLK
ncbi:MAG: glycerol-3-phosphate acyltransferase [candidate division WOR-3 bacterium]